MESCAGSGSANVRFRPIADIRMNRQHGRMRRIKELTSPTGKRQLCLYQREDGRYYFEEAYEDFDEVAGAYWTTGYQSGIFDDLEAAEVEMRSVTPWLRRES